MTSNWTFWSAFKVGTGFCVGPTIAICAILMLVGLIRINMTVIMLDKMAELVDCDISGEIVMHGLFGEEFIIDPRTKDSEP